MHLLLQFQVLECFEQYASNHGNNWRALHYCVMPLMMLVAERSHGLYLTRHGFVWLALKQALFASISPLFFFLVAY